MITDIGIGIGIAIPIIGVYIILGKHTGNANKHPKVENMVSEKSCGDRIHGVRDSIESSKELFVEKSSNATREMDRLHEETSNKFEIIADDMKEVMSLLRALKP